MNDKDYLLRTATAADGYYLMPRGTAQNRELSFEARGMLAYIMSHPPDWRVMPNDLQQKCGKNRVYRILNELIEAGYIIREPERNDDGTIKFWLYRVSDSPLPQNQELDNQEVENGDTYKVVKEESSNKTKTTSATQESAAVDDECHQAEKRDGMPDPFADKNDPNAPKPTPLHEYPTPEAQPIVPADTAPDMLPSWWTKQHTAIMADCFVNGSVPLRNKAIGNWAIATLHLIRQGYLEQTGTLVIATTKGKALENIPEIQAAVKSRVDGKASREAIKAMPKPEKKAKISDHSELSPEHRDLVAAIMQVWLHQDVSEFSSLLPATQNNLRRVAGQLRRGGYTPEDVIWYRTEWLPQQGDWRNDATYNCMVGNGNSMDVAKAKAKQQHRKPEVLLDPSTFEVQS